MKRRGPRSLALVVAMLGALGPNVARAESTVTYEVREQLTAVLLPSHDYDVTGSCATGTGVAPVSTYAEGGSGRGAGFGAGVGGRVGYHYAASPPNGRGRTWRGFRVGSGLDMNLLYASVATGIGDMSGKLCARVKSDGAEVQHQGTPMLLAQIPFFLGAELGLGTAGENASWDGVVLGAAWAPAMSYLKSGAGSGELSASVLGTELTVDFVTLHQDTAQRAGLRAAVFVLLPIGERDPIIMTLSVGAVWY